MMPLNALLALTILCDSNLRRRKELVFIVALAFADVLFGLGTLLTGCFRIHASNMLADGGNTTLPMVSPWSCYFTLRNMLTIYGMEVSILMLTAISLERLMAVAWFQKYANIGIRKLVAWAIAVFTFPLIPLSYASYQVYIASVQGALTSATCGIGPPDWYGLFHNWFSGTVGIVSVVLYGGVLLAYRKAKKLL
uniref:G-protein coupled receptors family 1 profile domain-containing protein n=1 Tax=Plectus sambesii TaxID=2011161 RepID=A0A914WZU5_9BILA